MWNGITLALRQHILQKGRYDEGVTPATQAALAARHPLFFDHAESPTAPGRPGIECGDGWVGLLDELFTALTPLLEGTLHLSNPPRLYEIGRRNGRLRILMRPMTPEMATLVYAAQDRSALVPENPPS